MRATWGALLFVCVAACGDDDDGGSFDARVVDAPVTVADAPVATDARTFDTILSTSDARTFDARASDAMIGAAPVIRTVVVTHAAGCTQATSTQVTVDIVATDVETTPGNLVYSVTGSGCSGTINASHGTLTCPEAATYSYTATVRDTDGNQASMQFDIVPCKNTPDAGPP